MVALVDTCWANGLWADTVWAAGVWAGGDAPPEVVTEPERHLGNLGWGVSKKQIDEMKKIRGKADAARKNRWDLEENERGDLVNTLKKAYGSVAEDVTAEAAEELTGAIGPHAQHPVSPTNVPPVSAVDWQNLDLKSIARLADALARQGDAKLKAQDDMEALRIILQGL